MPKTSFDVNDIGEGHLQKDVSGQGPVSVGGDSVQVGPQTLDGHPGVYLVGACQDEATLICSRQIAKALHVLGALFAKLWSSIEADSPPLGIVSAVLNRLGKG